MTTIPRPLLSRLLKDQPVGRLMAVAICGLGTLSVAQVPAYAQSDDTNDFWTHFVPSTDTRLVFVSSSEGNDNNNGLSPDRPVKTLDRAYDLLRDGYPDWMLLKRGDVWYENISRWHKSGRSADEKMVLGAYGDSSIRPQIRPAATETGLHGLGDGTVRHVAFVGFHLEPQERAPDESSTGIRWMQSSNDILFEDLYVDGFKDNISLQAYPSDNILEDLRINGCVIVDAWSGGGHSQGLYVSGVNGLTVENSVFDHNGWNEDMGAQPTIFNHNIYVQNNNQEITIRNNIISDASSHGVQLRPGGVVENNLFISNPLALLVGGGTNPNEGGIEGVVRNNLVMYGRDISDNLARAFGFTLSNIRQAVITENYFHISSVGYNRDVIKVGGDRDLMVRNLLIDKNLVLDWHGSFSISPPAAGQVLENITVTRNGFFRNLTPNSNGNINMPFVSVFDDWQADVRIENNNYIHYDMHDRPFKIGGARTSLDEWRQTVEPSALFESLSSAPPELGLDRYMQSIGETGDMQDFLNEARKMSRSNIQSRFVSASVIDWFVAETSSSGIRVPE